MLLTPVKHSNSSYGGGSKCASMGVCAAQYVKKVNDEDGVIVRRYDGTPAGLILKIIKFSNCY